MKLINDYNQKPDGSSINLSPPNSQIESMDQFMFIVDGQECISLNKKDEKEKRFSPQPESILRPFD